MSKVKTNKKEWETWMDNLIIKDAFQKENVPFYQFSEFQDIKRHRKLEIHDSILKFYGITKQVNEGSLRQYLKTNFQKMDWNTKLNFAKQIANVLMILHSNDIIHGKFNSENILVHNGIIKFTIFGITKTISDSLRFLTNTLDQIQYIDSQLFSMINKNKSSDIFGLGIILWEISSGNPPFEMESSSNIDLLHNITNIKSETAIPGTPHKYKEIYTGTDCWKQNGNSRPDIFQVVKNLSEIIISDERVEFETTQSQSYNVTDVKLENLNMQHEIKPDPPFVTTSFINDLFEFFIDTRKKQSRTILPIMIKICIRKHEKNLDEILYEMIRYPSNYWFTSLIGFFYQYGIGTVTDNQMAFKFFNLAANEIIDTSSSNSSSLRKLYNINKEIGTIALANMYLYGLDVEKNIKKVFQIYSKLADKGSSIALNALAFSAEKGNLVAQSNIGNCYKDGTGIAKDETKGFQWFIKSALAGNIEAMCSFGYGYGNSIGVGKDEKEAFKWYLKAAEKEHNMSQCNVGNCYRDSYGIYPDQGKAVEWYKKAAENFNTNGQFMLGLCFYEGHGTKKDIIKAIYWLNKAKENGHRHISANELLEEITRPVI
ncbi:hypothetical protein Glove_230g157 [Diversispora epigaea]|uniref:Protein kinase domain-containing protein n=1 Tax=Diversispora epigaea TaxID=1348612 RepID=A0A397IIJ6_9GLOM|nr:hypothetical protein Glove_230g157 [Diversispora epigaea]